MASENLETPNTTGNGSQNKLKATTKLAWGSGALADAMMANVISYLALPIYNIALGVDPRWLGWAMGLPRIWDAISDPVLGNISDNTRSRWGRRRPFIFVGAILSGIFFAVLWMPPASFSARAMGYYFLVTSFFFYTAYTIFVVPWNAMGLELTTDYDERTRVQAYRTFMQSIGGLLLGTLWWLSIKIGGEGNEVYGVKIVGIIFGVYVMITGMLPAIFCRSQISVPSQKKIPFIAAITTTAKNKTFILLGAIMFFLLIGLFLVNSFSNYINIYYVFGGSKEGTSKIAMIANFVFQTTGIGLVPLVSYLAVRFGKKRILLAGLTSVMAAYFTTWFFYTPKAPYLQLISLGMMAPGLSCVWVITASMLADICDVEEYHTGLRREGMYGAAFSWIIKAGIAFTLVGAGYMIDFSGYDSSLAMQTEDTILKMRLLYMLVPVAFIGTSFILVCFYPLTREKVEQIRHEINARNNAPNNPVDGTIETINDDDPVI
ncbi:Glucuronide permease [Limihaloglobus sulfuriphilus]|uniref:Glucuronide permease n=1 Tax=Limihaloglobus sulfuriphilus TaxID=1851148 RepID=A0A1Q2MI84_9BACT|nr:MFS transporter [Limihaloglobus sulfuriphilus]AQQ72238.1 Glucuronide permease [Limihaloglobus sulfuriphilus]